MTQQAYLHFLDDYNPKMKTEFVDFLIKKWSSKSVSKEIAQSLKGDGLGGGVFYRSTRGLRIQVPTKRLRKESKSTRLRNVQPNQNKVRKCITKV